MKKSVLCLLLALAMLITCAGVLSACGGDPDNQEDGQTPSKEPNPIVGSWTATVDASEAARAMVKSQLGEAADYFDADGLELVLVWDISLREDGSYEMTKTEQTRDGYYTSLLNMYAQAALKAMDTTEEDYRAVLESQNLTWDDFLSSVAITYQLDPDDLRPEKESSGHYAINGDQLYLLEYESSEVSDSDFMTFALEGDTLVISAVSGDFNEGWAAMEHISGISLYPVTFTKL